LSLHSDRDKLIYSIIIRFKDNKLMPIFQSKEKKLRLKEAIDFQFLQLQEQYLEETELRAKDYSSLTVVAGRFTCNKAKVTTETHPWLETNNKEILAQSTKEELKTTLASKWISIQTLTTNFYLLNNNRTLTLTLTILKCILKRLNRTQSRQKVLIETLTLGRLMMRIFCWLMSLARLDKIGRKVMLRLIVMIMLTLKAILIIIKNSSLNIHSRIRKEFIFRKVKRKEDSHLKNGS
jgi:hypothetical protein